MDLIRQALPAPTQINNASAAQRIVQMKDLDQSSGGVPLYLAGFVIGVNHDPTFTNQPTRAQLLQCIQGLGFYDGYRNYFANLNGSDLRAMGMLQNGYLAMPDPETDAPASTNNHHWEMVLWLADPRFEIDDFALPCAALAAKNAQLVINSGALADVGADTTAATTDYTITALLLPKDEVTVAAAQEWQREDFTVSPLRITGEAIYLDGVVFNGNAYDAIAATDFGEVTFDTGRETPIKRVAAEDLTACIWAEAGKGQLSEWNGEPRVASWTLPKTFLAGASNVAFALADTPATHQGLFRATAGWGSAAEITHGWYVPREAKITFSTLQGGTSRGLFHRVVARTDNEVEDMKNVTIRELGLGAHGAPHIKTKSGKPYRGPYGKFLPVKFPRA